MLILSPIPKQAISTLDPKDDTASGQFKNGGFGFRVSSEGLGGSDKGKEVPKLLQAGSPEQTQAISRLFRDGQVRT